MTPRRAATTPAAFAGLLGAVAFAAGVTKKWIVDPVGRAFGQLSPDGKVFVTALVVVGVSALLAFARLQHRSAVRATRARIDIDFQPTGMDGGDRGGRA